MKRMLPFLAVILLSVQVSSAQAYESSIQYDKKKQAAIAIEYSYSPEAVENAILQRLSKLGYKAKEEKGILNRDKGFLVYKNIFITDISRTRMDYLVKVERKGRKDNDQAILYLVIMKGEQNALQSMGPSDVDRTKDFLNELLPDVEASCLELEIAAQEEVVAKAEKKLSELKKDQKELEEKLDTNYKNQEDTTKDIESQKQKLEVLKGRRRD